MKELDSKFIVNIEINNLELLSQINILSDELNLKENEFILYSIKKLIKDIEYVRNLRD